MKTNTTTWTLNDNGNYILTVHDGWNVGIGLDQHGPHVIAIKTDNKPRVIAIDELPQPAQEALVGLAWLAEYTRWMIDAPGGGQTTVHRWSLHGPGIEERVLTLLGRPVEPPGSVGKFGVGRKSAWDS